MKGQVIVFIAIALVVLLALAGLAIDIGMAYGVKAKLNAAVDTAAIAAGRVIAQGTGAASTQAANFFDANYPRGLLGSTVSAPNTTAVHNADGSWTITVAASAVVPTNFAKVVGWRNFTVNASAETTVRTVDMMLVLDCSGSLGSAFGPLKTAAVNFINKFQAGAGGDRIGLVAFSSGAALIVPIDKTSARGFGKTNPYNDGVVTLPAMDSSISGLSQGTYTASAEAMRRALYELDLIPPGIRSSLRVIVFFSDGAPNTIAGSFQNGASTAVGDIPGYNSGSIDTLYFTNAGDSRQSGTFNIANINTLTVPPLVSPYTMDYSLSPSIGIPPPPPSTSADSLTETVNMLSYYGNTKRAFTLNGSNITKTICNVNSAARNMVENVANTARSAAGANAVTVFTIGLGVDLTQQEVPSCYGSSDSTEFGQNIMQRLANVKGVDTYNPNQPSGIYAYAADATQLDAAFTKIANQILRLSK